MKFKVFNFLYKILFFATVYLPLRVRDLIINFLMIFIDRDRVIKTLSPFLKNKYLLGILPDGNLLLYPLDDLKLLPIILENI